MQLLRSETGKILVEGHRGADALAPENSWTSILAAAEAGADLIEVDVQLTADEVPVVIHDYRLPGGAFVRATSSEALAEMDAGDGKAPPRVEEVLEWAVRSDIALTLDVKSGFGMGVTPFSRILETIARLDAAQQVMLASWDHMGLLWSKRHMPGITTRAFLRGVPIDLVAMAKRAEVDAISLSYDLIDSGDVEALHEAGIAVFLGEMWEPNFRYPVQLGVDGVIWGDPAEATFALARQGAR